MPIYAPIFTALQDAGVSFLVIGGHAVILLGHQRNTFDLDLLISDFGLTSARETLDRLGYRLYFESGAFVQLTPSNQLPPLDLMIVDETTFSRLLQHTETRRFDGVDILIPDAKRLVALKLHALKSISRRNREKDWEDIVEVLKATKHDLEEPELQRIVLQHGSEETLNELRRRS